MLDKKKMQGEIKKRKYHSNIVVGCKSAIIKQLPPQLRTKALISLLFFFLHSFFVEHQTLHDDR
jgi:hypothetical protein